MNWREFCIIIGDMLGLFDRWLVPIIGVAICAGVVAWALYHCRERPNAKQVRSFNPPDIRLAIGDWIVSISITAVGLWFLHGIVWIAWRTAFPLPWWAD